MDSNIHSLASEAEKIQPDYTMLDYYDAMHARPFLDMAAEREFPLGLAYSGPINDDRTQEHKSNNNTTTTSNIQLLASCSTTDLDRVLSHDGNSINTKSISPTSPSILLDSAACELTDPVASLTD